MPLPPDPFLYLSKSTRTGSETIIQVFGSFPLASAWRNAILLPLLLLLGVTMAIDVKPGQTVRVTINKAINRAAARKTIERLFCKDKELVKPLHLRSRNFKEQPKRRGGQTWTKRPNKIHLELVQWVAATSTATPQVLKDLASVGEFVQGSAK